MCIIIAKEQGREYNEQELVDAIKIAEIHNSHGAGFSLKRAGETKILVSKGYLYYYQLMIDRLEALDIQKDDELIIHLRYATAGNVDKQNCHPFIVSTDLPTILEDEVTTDLPVMAHNGTFYEYSDSNSPNSDTVNFVKEFLGQAGVLDSIYTIEAYNEIRSEQMLGTNRLCVMFPDDRPMMRIGDWNRLKKDDYCFVYSNYYHKFPSPAQAYGNSNPHTKVYH